MTASKKQLAGYVCAILSAVIYGCMPIMAKYVYAEGINALTLAFLRNALALPSLALLALGQQKTLACPSPRKTLLPLALPALFGGVLTPILLFGSYTFIASGIATTFHFVYPCLVLLIGIIFLRKRFSAITLCSVGICLVGIALFFDPGQTVDPLGSALALGSAVAFAVYVVLLSRFQSEQFSGFLFCFYFALWSSVILFLICICTGQLALPTTLAGWGLCLLFATSVTTGAVVLFQQGALRIGGEKASILSALEPITGVVIGIVFMKESAKPAVLIGSALVIASAVLIAVGDLKRAE
ncbi:MAG: DMT family transporter [Clostridia bacterium]|nr:DMT family transporter [Clostridia bacterium]